MMNLVFEDWWWLILLPLLGALWFWWTKKSDLHAPSVAVGSSASLNTMYSWRQWLYRSSRWLIVAATVFTVLAMARPQRQFVERNEKSEGIDIFLVMDVSTSMLAQDFSPDRLEASRLVAQNFVGDRPFDRIGLVAFAGEAFTLSPLTLDHPVVQQMLGNLTAGVLEDGTAMGMGLATAVNRLSNSDAKSKIVILLTDGVNNGGDIDPATAAELAEQFGIKVYTIGVGSNGRARSPIQLNNSSIRMQYVRVQLDEELLQDIAERTGGKYFRATDNQSLQQVYQEIDQLEKTPVEVSVSRRFDDLYFYPLSLAALLALLAGIIRIVIVPRLV